jgi:chromosome segregation ATPase
MLRFGIPLLLFCLSACDSVNTFVGATGDLTSGRTAQSVDESRQRQAAARSENVSLSSQYAALQSQRAALRGQLSAAQVRLRGVNQKLSQETTVTQAQRDEYTRLVAKQKDLQQRLATVSATPVPSNPAAAADQKAQLDQLAQEKDVLERQVNALQRAL